MNEKTFIQELLVWILLELDFSRRTLWTFMLCLGYRKYLLYGKAKEKVYISEGP